MEATELPSGEISGTVLLYSRPEPLNPELHGKLGVRQLDNPFAFAAKTHLIPLTVTEFQPAALSYPIIFVGTDYTPVAVMGLRDDFNLFLPETGQPDPEIYIPAYVRRYPFVFANDSSTDRMILCIDRGADVLDENGGLVPLFDGIEPSAFTKNAMEFCQEFESERRRTEEFVNLLKGLDLFEIKQATFTPRMPDGTTGEPQILAEYFAVSEEKLNKVSKDKLLEMQRNGALLQIHAHMISLLGWERLVARAMVRDPQASVANDTAANA